MQIVSAFNVGAPNVPQEVRRLRRESMDMLRRLGEPVVVRHMWNREDVEAGRARECPACYDGAYDQVRNDCPVCFGFGFASVEDEPTGFFFLDTNGQISLGNPGTDLPAPRYGGFDKPYLTWLAEPDVAVDIFRLTDSGALVRTYDAQGVAPWTPTLGDNDLCINVTLAPDGYNIVADNERFQLKRVQQVTLRGWGKRTRGQAYLCGQTFAMSKAPNNSSLYAVPVDPVWGF